jgi:GDPmannose 4,6-dehydratase
MVGSHLTDFLLANSDWDVHGLCRWRSPLDNVEHLFDRVNSKDRVYFHYGDLNDPHSLLNVLSEVKPDYIFHLAAQSYPRTSFDAPLDTMRTNVLGTLSLLETARQIVPNAVIHNCASSEVFGRVPREKLPINEECTFHPASPYAISKTGTDLIGRFYGEAYGMRVVSTRMFTHTGPRRGDVFAESTFAKQIAMIEHNMLPPVLMVGNLDSLRTWADVRDAVRAYYMLVTIDPEPGQYYNIGGTFTCTIREMLNHLLSLSPMGDKIEVRTDPDRIRPIDADLQVPDTTKFRKKTGWEPKYTFEQTMGDLLAYWRQRVTTRQFLQR